MKTVAVQTANAEKKVIIISGRIAKTIPGTGKATTTTEHPERTAQMRDQEMIVEKEKAANWQEKCKKTTQWFVGTMT